MLFDVIFIEYNLVFTKNVVESVYATYNSLWRRPGGQIWN